LTINIANAFKVGVEQYRVNVPLLGADWADEYFYLSPESSGIEGRWKCYPYQIALINWMTDDDIEEFNILKSRRVGYTKCLMAAIASEIKQKKRNVAVWQPTDGDAKDFTIDEIDTMLRDVPVLGEMLKCKVGAKSKYNTNDKKVFRGATLDIKGGKSARNYRRMTKDLAAYDEASAFDTDIDGEGSCFELGDGRLDAAPFPKSIRGTTPKTKGVDIVEAAIEKCDRVFYRYVKCPHCGLLQRLEFENLKVKGNEAGKFICKYNGCVIEYQDYSDMDSAGRWQTLDGYYYVDKENQFYDPDNNKIDKPKRIGARIWAGYSYLRPWSYVADKWVNASRDAKTGNLSPLKAVINTLLGETYEEKGESVDSSGLLDRLDNYHPDVAIPNGVLFITFGTDVQGGKNPRLELEFVGHGLEDETWSIDYVVIEGDAEQQAVWDHHDDQVARRFKREDGVELGVAGGFVDSGYLATEVYKYTGPRRRRNIYATKGVNTGTLCNKGSWQGEKKKRSRAILHTMNVDDAKTIIFNRLKKITKPGPGFCHFPKHYKEKHFTQLTNEEKREKKKAGRLIGFEWVKLGRNEPLDCRAYNLGIKHRLNPNLARIKMRLDAEANRLNLNLPPQQKRSGRRVRSSGLR
jgi:phage terminase large subunit GpA-like protein